jgi:hypothetical protein
MTKIKLEDKLTSSFSVFFSEDFDIEGYQQKYDN